MAKIILLNGTSSSGKSSIANLLHKSLIDSPYLKLEIDTFLNMLPLENFASQEKLISAIPPLVFGFHSSVKNFAQLGMNCIVDHVLQEPGWFEDFERKTKELDVIIVKVFCPLDVLEKREKQRGDREIGLAKSQFDKVHT